MIFLHLSYPAVCCQKVSESYVLWNFTARQDEAQQTLKVCECPRKLPPGFLFARFGSIPAEGTQKASKWRPIIGGQKVQSRLPKE